MIYVQRRVRTKPNPAGDIMQARDQLGHTTVVMTEQYIRNRKGKKSIVNKVNCGPTLKLRIRNKQGFASAFARKPLILNGARSRNRTGTPLRAGDFKSTIFLLKIIYLATSLLRNLAVTVHWHALIFLPSGSDCGAKKSQRDHSSPQPVAATQCHL